eukprot:13546110-Ditylum_brightwellii.AAC.1
MHEESIRKEEEEADIITQEASVRFGGESLPKSLTEVIDIKREEEAAKNAMATKLGKQLGQAYG